MTANLAPDAERVLDAYAEATRIVASAQLVRRFQAGVADERAREARRPWSGMVAWLRGTRLRLAEPFSIAFAPHVTFALRLQSLALVLLTVLALSALVGGAGAVVVRVVDGPHRGPDVPGRVWVPAPAVPVPSTAPVPAQTSKAPVVTTTVLAQHAPRKTHRAWAERRRAHAEIQHLRAERRQARMERLLETGRNGCSVTGGWSRGRHCAS